MADTHRAEVTAIPATGAAEVVSVRRGRPPATSRRALELIALRLFTDAGFEETTIEDITSQANVSRRAFFRYFDSKTSLLWGDFDDEVAALRAAFAAVPAGVDTMTAIREVVVGVNQYHAQDVPELRIRMNLVANVPALQASSAPHYDAWERAVSDFAAARSGQPADSLYPQAIGRTTLAACRAAYDQWLTRADADLTVYLDAALTGLADGFATASSPGGRSESAPGSGQHCVQGQGDKQQAQIGDGQVE